MAMEASDVRTQQERRRVVFDSRWEHRRCGHCVPEKKVPAFSYDSSGTLERWNVSSFWR
jgi:hypothetical protein